MKAAIALALLLCAGIGLAAEQSRSPRISIRGREYVRIDQWARANGYQWKWVSKTDASVWNNSWRIQLTADSKRMTVNGISILLSEAVRNQSGVPHVAAIDFSTAI